MKKVKSTKLLCWMHLECIYLSRVHNKQQCLARENVMEKINKDTEKGFFFFSISFYLQVTSL